MKKVAILKRRFGSYGGLEKYAFRIAQAFAESGCEVHILAGEAGKSQTYSSNVYIHRFDVDSILGFRTIELYNQACEQWLKTHPMDIVFGMDRTRAGTHIRAGNGVHASYLEMRKLSDSLFKQFTYGFNPLHKLILDIEKKSFESSQVERIFTNSQYVKEQILEHYSTDEDKISVVHNGVEWHEYSPYFASWLEAKARVAGESKVDPTKYQFLFIGNGYKRKGLKHLLDGLALLPTRDFHLSVIGKEKNTAAFVEYTKKVGLESCVTFFGTQKNITPFYQLADCSVIPSIYDPFANVTVESLAMGVHVISSSYNGGKEVLTDESGTIIESLTSPDSVKEALERAFEHPKTWLRSQNIRNSVQYLDFANQLGAIITPCIEG